jgi:hypothetical protein
MHGLRVVFEFMPTYGRVITIDVWAIEPQQKEAVFRHI